MKKVLVVVLLGCVFVISQGAREVTADEEETNGLPLSALNGTYSFTTRGSIFFCVKETAPFPPAQCGSAGSIGFPLTILDLGTVIGNNGVSCATFTETESDLPVDVSPPFVLLLHTVVKVTSYDPATGTGDASFKVYEGGQCHGATFDKTGATLVSSGTEHLAASLDGDQLDVLITSLTNPAHAIGDFSFSGTALRLHRRRSIPLP
jgi:hypothetical protein